MTKHIHASTRTAISTRGALRTALCALVITASAGAQANLLTNGSFEGAPDTQTAFGNGSTGITGWTVFFAADTNPNANIQWLNNNNTYGIGTPKTKAQDGTSFIDLTGLADVQPYAGIDQTFATTAGQAYTVTFYLGCDNNSSGYGCPVGVTASVDGASSMNYTNSVFDSGNQWAAETYNFTAGAGTSSTLRFRGFAVTQNNSTNSIYIGLDNVDAERAAVPEPETIALLGVGLLACIVGSRRRRA